MNKANHKSEQRDAERTAERMALIPKGYTLAFCVKQAILFHQGEESEKPDSVY